MAGTGLLVVVFDIFGQFECGGVFSAGVFSLPARMIGLGEAIEYHGFAGSVTDHAADPQSVLVVADGLLVVALLATDDAKAGEGEDFSDWEADVSADFEGVLMVVGRLLVVALLPGGQAEIAECPDFADSAADIAADV